MHRIESQGARGTGPKWKMKVRIGGVRRDSDHDDNNGGRGLRETQTHSLSDPHPNDGRSRVGQR